jgi:hypothetical protein
MDEKAITQEAKDMIKVSKTTLNRGEVK